MMVQYASLTPSRKNPTSFASASDLCKNPTTSSGTALAEHWEGNRKVEWPVVEDTLFQRAAQAVTSADALLIAAGAGMGVDSGLPDFRGDQGFWKAYPPYQKLGLRFATLANPQWFTTDPALAWGFYGRRLNLYRATQPHVGFRILRSWAGRMKHGAFVFTSNVDGQFQWAGFDPERILEVHGSIDWLQCTGDCGAGLFPADTVVISVDEATMRAREPLPRCPACGALARPNLLMFGDWGWDDRRSRMQQIRLEDWLATSRASFGVIIECGRSEEHTSE